MIVILLEQVLDDDCNELGPSKAIRSEFILGQGGPLIGFDRFNDPARQQISE
jgi:hypothetical protein